MTAPSFRDVVAKHHTDSSAVLVANREPCISIALDEDANVHGRSFLHASPDDLDELELEDSWIMAVLLCAGDTTEHLANWSLEEDRDPRRVVFYVHTDTDPRAALEAWHEAGLPVHSTWTIENWRQLHKHFGAAWNVRVYDDFRQA